MEQHRLTAALEMLGEVLESRSLSFDLAVIGGGALLLRELVERPTADLDVVARVEEGKWISAKPLPMPLVEAIRDVAEALDLPRQPRDEKDWLNAGPAILQKIGLPPGFDARAEQRAFGSLTIRIADRLDLIFLKLWAATAASRGSRRAVDIQDLREIDPTRDEIRRALEWCAQKDGRPEFIEVDALPVLARLGFSRSEVADD